MADTPNDGPEVKKHSEPALRATRRRLLQGMGSSMALSLAGCGYGFVVPRTVSSDPFTIQMRDQEQQILKFYDRLFSDGSLQKSFVADPMRTMIANGAIREESDVVIERGNVLFLYMIGNDAIMHQLQAIAQKHAVASNKLNAFTRNNINLDVVENVRQRIRDDPDVQAMLQDQISALVSDERFRQILGINVSDAGVENYSKQLTASMISYVRLGRSRAMGLYPIINLAVFANIGGVLNAIAIANANLGANANVIVNYDYALDTSGASYCRDAPSGGLSKTRTQNVSMLGASCSDFHSFVAELSSRAQEIQRGG